MARGGGDGQIPDGTSDELSRADGSSKVLKAAANQHGSIDGRKDRKRDKYKNKFFPAFHASSPFGCHCRGYLPTFCINKRTPPNYFPSWIANFTAERLYLNQRHAAAERAIRASL